MTRIKMSRAKFQTLTRRMVRAVNRLARVHKSDTEALAWRVFTVAQRWQRFTDPLDLYGDYPGPASEAHKPGGIRETLHNLLG